jgi:hypothetical protein
MDKKSTEDIEEEVDPQVHIKHINFDVKKRDVFPKMEKFGRV